ncbi:hypothetical protein L1887_61058 [Cichorium endivia]|nr:hypothetical protein L1887_61058 [Cichorium endivia]
MDEIESLHVRLGDALDGRLGELSEVLVVLQLLRLVSQQRRLAELLGLGLLLLLLFLWRLLGRRAPGRFGRGGWLLVPALGPSSSSSCSAADSDPDDRLVRLRWQPGWHWRASWQPSWIRPLPRMTRVMGDGFLGIGGSLVLADLRGLGACRRWALWPGDLEALVIGRHLCGCRWWWMVRQLSHVRMRPCQEGTTRRTLEEGVAQQKWMRRGRLGRALCCLRVATWRKCSPACTKRRCFRPFSSLHVGLRQPSAFELARTDDGSDDTNQSRWLWSLRLKAPTAPCVTSDGAISSATIAAAALIHTKSDGKASEHGE